MEKVRQWAQRSVAARDSLILQEAEDASGLLDGDDDDDDDDDDPTLGGFIVEDGDEDEDDASFHRNLNAALTIAADAQPHEPPGNV